MRTVNHVLQRKGNKVTIVPPEMTVIDALRIMADQNIGSVVVMRENRFAGIMTERDYSRKVILKDRHSSDTPVGDIMTTDFPFVGINNSVDSCMQLMTSHRLRYLPVIEGEQLLGIISINDLVTETILSQAETINQLQSYIQS
ncbi:MAG: CBS domain-containing protein [Chitinophagaceae bacterium]|nr:CBS domain-containing protein [Chitinophagaceae bacterium]